MALHDVQARVYEKKEKKDEMAWTLLPNLAIKFDDSLRMRFTTAESGAWPPRQGTLEWGEPSPKRRFITLSPGDSMEMSDSCIVPRGVIYKVEVVVLTVHPVEDESIEASKRPFSQWRSSKIVYPCPPLLLDRLKPFSSDELSALLFSLDIAGTVEPFRPEAKQIQQELIDELKERGSIKVPRP